MVLSFDVIVFYLFYISFNVTVICFESGFTGHFIAVIENLALVGFLCNLGVQYKFGSFLFIPLTPRLNLYLRSNVLSDTI